MRRLSLLISCLIMVFLLSGCGLVDKLNAAVDPNNDVEVVYTIPSGASTSSIANDLKELGLINNVMAFKYLSKTEGYDGKMQAGEYSLSKQMSSDEMMKKFISGEVIEHTVDFTIPEGYEVREIIDLLVKKDLGTREVFYEVLENHPFDYVFLKNVDRQYHLEGYLFPDTYTVDVNATEVEIIDKMLQRFNQVVKQEDYQRAEALGMTMNDVIILASIIEREAMLDEERPIVASVFYNRLEDHYLLQSCASVQYVLKERKPVLSIADTKLDSPYNTYQNLGLTPAPIASPGAASIQAALYPADTNYYYFVTTEKNDGSHYFNETLAGHNRDKAKSNL